MWFLWQLPIQSLVYEPQTTRRNSRFSTKSEAFASEWAENLVEMFIWGYICYDKVLTNIQSHDSVLPAAKGLKHCVFINSKSAIRPLTYAYGGPEAEINMRPR